MTLAELIALCREQTDDTVAAGGEYLVSDVLYTRFANNAVREACQRGASIRARYALSVPAGTLSVSVDPSIITILSARYDDALITQVPAVGYDYIRDYATSTGQPRAFIYTAHTVSLFPAPAESGTLTLDVYRYPITPLAELTDEPEIDEEHHAHLSHWMTFEAAGLWDEAKDGVYDPELSQRALALFTQHFGSPRSALELRSWRDLPRDTQVRARYFA